VTLSGQTKVLDFGIARELKDSLTRVTGRETSGTLLYMSPEQYSGRPPNPASDVYSFAATLYECLAGHPPFYQGAIGHQLLEVAPTAIPGLPAQVNEALLAGLAKEPSERPATAQDLVERCAAAVRPAPGPARASTRLRVQRRALWAALLLVALGISVGLWALIRPGDSFGPAPHVATGWPFDAAEAKRRQQAAADALGVPVVTEVSLRGGATMRFVFIPPGTFTRGSPATETGRRPEETPHEVTLTRGFYFGVTEVTQAQWQAVMGWNQSEFKGDDLPVQEVSWLMCQQFLGRLGRGFRLPTEAEWEYACRAGSSASFSFGDQGSELARYAWHAGNSGSKAGLVGRLAANAWGLFDMHGNLWEWCADVYGAYPGDPVTDPTGPTSATTGPMSKTYRVRRGGCWLSPAADCRAAYRHASTADGRTNTIGFRVVLDVEPPAAPTSK